LQNKAQYLNQLLEEALKTHLFSGYQLYAEFQGEPLSLFGGQSSYWPGGKPITENHLFDLGSLTKVLATTSLYALAIEEGVIKFEDLVGEILPILEGTAYHEIEVVDLLTHESGLVGWYPLFQEGAGVSLLEWLKGHEKEIITCSPRQQTEYSDLGFLLLGAMLEKKWGPLDKVFEEKIKKPLQLERIQYGPVRTDKAVATEYCLWQQKLLLGEAFDENCRSLGGVCSHAGLFANASTVAIFAKEWLRALQGNSTWLTQKVAEKFIKVWSSRSTWALGWDTKSPENSSCGEFFSPKSFGHLGFPGTSLWMDPERDAYVVFLTNRVHPSRLDERIRGLRPQVHDAMVEFWEHE